MTIQQVLDGAMLKLMPVTAEARGEAERLLAMVLNQSRSYLRAWPEKNLTREEISDFEEWVRRRSLGEPMAYLQGVKEFWSLPFQVTPDTLIPRPETEVLVEQVLAIFPDPHPVVKLADLGTGCGAVAIALAHERPAWAVCAVDVSESALCIARKNARQLAINSISFYLGNWCTALPCHGFDVIVSNPPYVSELEWEQYARGLAFEPIGALVSGSDGLNAIREIASEAQNYLKSGGYLLMEHGFSQGPAVRALLKAAHYQRIRTVCDLAGRERVTVGRSSVIVRRAVP